VLAVPLLCQVLLQHRNASVTLYLALQQPALLPLYALQLGHDAAVLLLQLMHQSRQLVLRRLLLLLQVLLLCLCYLLVRGVTHSIALAVLLVSCHLRLQAGSSKRGVCVCMWRPSRITATKATQS
jgi:hypothetical protein